MLLSYRTTDGRLGPLDPGVAMDEAVWIDLYRPLPAEVAAVEALGVAVPTLADMEEIELSNRLYRDDGVEVMTVVLPGLSSSRAAMSGPVSFILTPARLVTVRHHAPRPFETYPARADQSSAGCASPEAVFLGLAEEIVARMADLLEGAGAALDRIARGIYGGGAAVDPQFLHETLVEAGNQGELLGRVRLGLLTLERALSYFTVNAGARAGEGTRKGLVKGLHRDIQALEVHADFLGARVALISDATLGMINLGQNRAVKSLSVVAALFLPPTLIASVFGMNFAGMDILDQPWGYPAALAMMAGSGLATFVLFRWRKWL